ncbi:hypothetical protein PFISCL1PPCAC_11403 [Pristionchus fissidentatus]|uniref:Uncharacterized protein n=1 Tax=Pristionchus fissidentatus TaxID=1538716 RepID=A0AAV5VNA7_9BILA|nr:hypothetical protein PFISCL1PPCAC_11403 [Pristionchus fissidentatus]
MQKEPSDYAANKERALRTELEKAVRSKGKGEKGEVRARIDLGEYLKSNKRNKEAIEEYEAALVVDSVENKVVLHILDQLVTLHAQEGNHDYAMKYIDQYDKTSSSDEEVHLREYTVGWSLLELYRLDENEELIKMAKERVVRSMDILKNKRKEVEQSLYKETIKQRERSLTTHLAEIHGILKEEKEAEECIKSALILCKRSEVSKFEVLNVKYAFEWSNRVEVAQKLVKLARRSESRLIEALFLLAKAHFEKESMENGIEDLYEIYHHSSSHGTAGNIEELEKLAVFAYKVRAVKKRLIECEKEKDVEGQYRCEDQLGDLFTYADEENILNKERASIHYDEAYKLAPTREGKKSTLSSLAVTAWTNHEYQEAIRFYEEKMKEEEDAGEDITETEVEIFKTKVAVDLFATCPKMVEEAERLAVIPGNQFVDDIYNCLAEKFEEKGRVSDWKKYKNLADEFTKRKKPICGKDSDKKEKENPAVKFCDDGKILALFEQESVEFHLRRIEDNQKKEENKSMSTPRSVKKAEEARNRGKRARSGINKYEDSNTHNVKRRSRRGVELSKDNEDEGQREKEGMEEEERGRSMSTGAGLISQEEENSQNDMMVPHDSMAEQPKHQAKVEEEHEAIAAPASTEVVQPPSIKTGRNGIAEKVTRETESLRAPVVTQGKGGQVAKDTKKVKEEEPIDISDDEEDNTPVKRYQVVATNDSNADSIFVRVKVFMGNSKKEEEETYMTMCPIDTLVEDLINIKGKLQKLAGGRECMWSYDNNILQAISIRVVASLTNVQPFQLSCRVMD